LGCPTRDSAIKKPNSGRRSTGAVTRLRGQEDKRRLNGVARLRYLSPELCSPPCADTGGPGSAVGTRRCRRRGRRRAMVEGSRRSVHWAPKPAVVGEIGRDLEGNKQRQENAEIKLGEGKGKGIMGGKGRSRKGRARSPATAGLQRRVRHQELPRRRHADSTAPAAVRHEDRGPPLAARRPANSHAQHTDSIRNRA
jgi:hypothetical protein